MFINLTNEGFQHLFTGIMFEKEMEAYKKEGTAILFDPGDGNSLIGSSSTPSTSPPVS